MIKLVYEHMPSVLIGTLQKDDETGDMTLYVNLGQKELISKCFGAVPCDAVEPVETGELVYYERGKEGIKKVATGFGNVMQNITQIGENNTIQNISQTVNENRSDEEKEEDQGYYAVDD